MLLLFAFCCTAAVASHNADLNFARDPNGILDELLKGNERFVAGTSTHPDIDSDRRINTAKNGQKPIASVLSCSDSRVPVEDIFDAGIGTLFIVRVAGNIAEKSQVGSLEYGAGHLGIPLIIVLGHTKCGAVTAAVENGQVSVPIKTIINNIEPAVARARKSSGEIAEEDLILKSITENVWQTIEDIFKISGKIRALVKTGKVKIVGAMYDIETGKVRPLGVHLRQDLLIKKYEQNKGAGTRTDKK
jgi:carbonic anhydrase